MTGRISNNLCYNQYIPALNIGSEEEEEWVSVFWNGQVFNGEVPDKLHSMEYRCGLTLEGNSIVLTD